MGPTLIEANVERYLPHTSDDDDSIYRLTEEIEEAKKRDPLQLLNKQLFELNILDEKEDQAIRENAKNIVNMATEEAENAPYPKTTDFHKHVYSE